MLHLLLLPLNPIWSTATTWVGSARFDVPMCPQCHRASFRRRWLGRVLPLLILIVLLLAGLWLGRWVVSLHPQPWFANVVTAAVLAIAIGSAIGINQLIRLPVDVVPAKDKLVFSFESHEAATAFAQMNEVQVENRPEELFQEIMQELFGTRSDSDCQA